MVVTRFGRVALFGGRQTRRAWNFSNHQEGFWARQRRSCMTSAEQYRELAAQLRAKARHEESSWLRAEWERLANCYVLLAKESDRKSQLGAERMTQTDTATSLRRHVLERGFIIIGEKALKLDCTVRSASRLGATLQVATTFGIPLYCDLVIDEKRRHCRVQWKTATTIGVLFQ